MSSKSLVVLAALVFVALGTGVALAEEGSSVEFEVTADFFSKYIWRGQNLNEDYAFQPGISASYAGFTGGVWGSLDMTDYGDNEGEFTEVDYYVDYSGSVPGVEGVEFAVGVVNYHFPSIYGDTTEIYWGLGFDLPLSPSVSVYHDVDQADGTYVSFGIGQDFGTIVELAEGMPVGMDFSASLGLADGDYNEFYWGTKDAGLNDLALSVSFPFEVFGWSVSPSLNYVTLVDGALRSSDSFVQSSDYFYTGIGLSTSF